MIRKQDLEDKWVFSRWRKVDNDSADITSSCRSFHVRGPTTAESLIDDGCQLSRSHCQTFGSRKAERSTAT